MPGRSVIAFGLQAGYLVATWQCRRRGHRAVSANPAQSPTANGCCPIAPGGPEISASAAIILRTPVPAAQLSIWPRCAWWVFSNWIEMMTGSSLRAHRMSSLDSPIPCSVASSASSDPPSASGKALSLSSSASQGVQSLTSCCQASRRGTRSSWLRGFSCSSLPREVGAQDGTIDCASKIALDLSPKWIGGSWSALQPRWVHRGFSLSAGDK